jgi:hydroxymethylpyrimidine/phosphomethylpyrimidine kinase
VPPFALTIAGFDPSGGAGILADIKVFSHYKVYGQAVCTALTVQNESAFVSPGWLPWNRIAEQLEILISARTFRHVKIGLVENLQTLTVILEWLRKHLPEAFILWDPIVKASAGYSFHDVADKDRLKEILGKIDLVTPNHPEAEFLSGKKDMNALAELEFYTNVLLKGGHSAESDRCIDWLSQKGKRLRLESARVPSERHGSGCTLSAAILANLALGHSLEESCAIAKQYMECFFRQGSGLLGFVE